jgi:hypothetical protein|nr:hypothetical protein [Kofleriaceae bacterium]
MKALGLVLGIVLAAAACGDDTNHVGNSDGGKDSGMIDSGSGSGGGTLTAFVLDLVNNHGTDATPATFDSFKDLPDPDATIDLSTGSDPYASLF